MKYFLLILSLLLVSSCSLFGIQNEEKPKYKTIKEDSSFEIREYSPYIIATVEMSEYDKQSTRKAFKILASYIFGNNKSSNKFPMTSPVEINQEKVRISMTSPVEILKKQNKYSMSFVLPSKYTLKNLPRPNDRRIKFSQTKNKLVAVNKFTWFSNKDRNRKKAQELRIWVKKNTEYKLENNDFKFAGYNPPWTIPFLKRNEILIDIKEI